MTFRDWDTWIADNVPRGSLTLEQLHANARFAGISPRNLTDQFEDCHGRQYVTLRVAASRIASAGGTLVVSMVLEVVYDGHKVIEQNCQPSISLVVDDLFGSSGFERSTPRQTVDPFPTDPIARYRMFDACREIVWRSGTFDPHAL